jgi:phage terminase large subunit
MLTIDTARIFEPLLEPARYKGAWGGRGSAKSWFLSYSCDTPCQPLGIV